VLQLLAAWAILTARGAPPVPGDVALAMGQRTIEIAQLAAVVALLSALVNGIGDLGLWFLVQLAGGILTVAAQAKRWPWLGRVGDEIGRIVNPSVNLAGLTNGIGGAEPLVAALSTAALALVVAVLLINRKELSYASAGG
jgi:hypothetical protein